MTCTGKTLKENLVGHINKNPEVIRPIDTPYSQTGGIAVLYGNLAPDGCVVKRSAVAEEMLVHEVRPKSITAKKRPSKESLEKKLKPAMSL